MKANAGVAQQDELVRALGGVVGQDNVASSDARAAHLPSIVVAPGGHDEVRECLGVCAALGAAVIPAGRLTWIECGNPVTRADVVLTLKRMNRVIDYSPADLTCTVEAGVGLSQLNDLARASGQWLPLDPPGARDATVGAVAACANGGALRFGFGGIRDYAIGLRLAHADGTDSKAGGRVVKNVAGYDMTKLYLGSYGTLAVITEVTVKLRPLPQWQATIAIAAQDDASLIDLGARIIRSGVLPASVFFLSGGFGQLGSSSAKLLVRFVDSAETVDHQVRRVREMLGGGFDGTLLDDESAAAGWAAVADVDRCEEVALRISVPISRIGTALLNASQYNRTALAADLAMGTIRVGLEERGFDAVTAVQSLRVKARQLGGHLFVERAPLDVRSRVDVWGDPGASARLMKSLKRKFDPTGMLNPGRFLDGI